MVAMRRQSGEKFDREKALRKQATRTVVSQTVSDSHAFAEFDQDGNQKLDFDEFYAMQPQQIRDKFSVKDIRAWFHKADEDGNGTLCINEYFRWSLSNAVQQHGADALSRAFEKYDRDGTGQLDAMEWADACHSLGFGAGANDIFKQLDADGNGTVSYKELVEQLTSNLPSDPEAKAMLCGLVHTISQSYGETKRVETAKRLDTSDWRVRGQTVQTITSEIRELYEASGCQVADIVKLFEDGGDSSGNAMISDVEFIHTMKREFGYRGPVNVLAELFNLCDTDKSGRIGFDELYELIRGQRHSLDHRKAIDVQLIAPEGFSGLDEVAWDTVALRALMNDMLERSQVGPVDLLRAWRGRRGLNREEFLHRVRLLFAREDPDLWENEVAEVASEAFEELKRMVRGENFLRKITILHLERWLCGSNPGDFDPSIDRDPPPPTFQRLYTSAESACTRKSKRHMKEVLKRRYDHAPSPPLILSWSDEYLRACLG